MPFRLQDSFAAAGAPIFFPYRLLDIYMADEALGIALQTGERKMILLPITSTIDGHSQAAARKGIVGK